VLGVKNTGSKGPNQHTPSASLSNVCRNFLITAALFVSHALHDAYCTTLFRHNYKRNFTILVASFDNHQLLCKVDSKMKSSKKLEVGSK
jgi:hypothetical protein